MTVIKKDGKTNISLEGRIDTNNAAQTESIYRRNSICEITQRKQILS